MIIMPTTNTLKVRFHWSCNHENLSIWTSIKKNKLCWTTFKLELFRWRTCTTLSNDRDWYLDDILNPAWLNSKNMRDSIYSRRTISFILECTDLFPIAQRVKQCYGLHIGLGFDWNINRSSHPHTHTTSPLKLSSTVPQALHYFVFFYLWFLFLQQSMRSVNLSETHTQNHWKTIRFWFMRSTLKCIFRHQQFEWTFFP